MDPRPPTTGDSLPSNSRSPDAFPLDEERAFNQLIEEHRPRMLAIAARFAYGAVGAEDVVQQACIEAYEGRDKLRDPKAAGAWLAGIVRNVGCQEARKHARQTGLLEEHAERLMASQAPHTEDAILRKLAVRRAVDELPDVQRTVVVCRWFEEMPLKEIAACLGRPEGTVRSDLFRAHAALRKKLR